MKKLLLAVLLCFSCLLHSQQLKRATVSQGGQNTSISVNGRNLVVSQSIGQASVHGSYKNAIQGYQQPALAASFLDEAPPGFPEISLYPNPVDGVLNIAFAKAQSQQTSFTLFDINGRLIKTTHSQGVERFELDMSGLSSGVYLLNMVQGTAKRTAKIIKQ